MSKLSFAEISKTFGARSPEAGNPRFTAITRKIEEGSPFRLTNGRQTPLFFKEESIEKAFKTFNLDAIQKYTSGRGTKPFIDSEGTLYAIGELEKTHEFGGASGGGSPPDPHELMTAALILQYGSKGLKKIPKEIYSNLNVASTAIKNLKGIAHNIETTESDKERKIEAFDNNFESFAQAISAADGFLENMPTNGTVVIVYGTGRKWSSILQPYKLDDHILFGKKDYNSSDMIVQVSKPKGITFVGISLKKKGLRGADPTVINKTVIGTDGLLTALVKQGYFAAKQDFNEVYEARAQFFYNVIRAAIFDDNAKVRSDARRKVGLGNRSPTKFLEGLEKMIKPSQTVTKGILAVAQKLGQNNMTNALKGKYPESGVLNIYFEAFNRIMMNPAYAEPIVLALLNIIFKTDLTGFLKLRGVPREEFKFTLITGKGKFSGGQIQVGKADELQETFTTSLITELLNVKNTALYKVTKTTGKKQAYEAGATAAKLFYTIWVGNTEMADVEIRYKGSIRSEPQFFAVITPIFKGLYNKRVKSSGGHKKW